MSAFRKYLLGIGSPHGDDRAGWEVVEQVMANLPQGVFAAVCADPQFILDIPPECEILVVVDACRGGGIPGSLHRYVWPDDRLLTRGELSSHGIGLANTLALAETLSTLPPQVIIFAVEAEWAAPESTMSPAVASVIPLLVSRVLNALASEKVMSEPVPPARLRMLAFFTPASDDLLQRLSLATRSVFFPAGSILFREGNQLEDVFIVASGTVALEIVGRDHRARRFQTVGTGELLGWSPVLDSSPMTASARALSDVEVVALDASAIRDLCNSDPRFGYYFMRQVAAAIAARLHATRLQLLDVFNVELPQTPEGNGL